MVQDNLDYNSDQEVSVQHSKLLKNVAKLDKTPRSIKRAERTEATFKVSERDLVKSAITDADLVRDFAVFKPLGGKSHHREITKQNIAYKKKAKTLYKPPERIIADKAKRQVGYENTKKEVARWDPVIQRNRAAPTLSFPLKSSSFKKETKKDYAQRFTPLSDLEIALAALEPEKENKEKPKKDDFDLTLEEVVLKRHEAAKFRAQQSYKEAKAHRLKKIKSKTFHRIERKAKIRNELKNFELLQKTDPEAALEKLQQLDRVRAEERMSLRHKNTGQWAKSKLVRAKYDKDTRQVLAQQLSISRELTQKVRKDESSDDDEEEQTTLAIPSSAEDNPWLNNVKTDKEINDFVTEYRKFSDKQKKTTNDKATIENSVPAAVEPPVIKIMKNRESAFNPVVQVETIEQGPKRGIDNTDKYKWVNPQLSKVKPAKIARAIQTKAATINSQKPDVKPAKIAKIVPAKTGTIVNSQKPKVKPAKKISKIIQAKAGTTEWSVESFENDSNNSGNNVKSLEIDDIFDSMETKLKQKLKKKLRKVRQELRNEPDEDVEAEENDSDNDGVDLSFKKPKLRPEIDRPLSETAGDKEINSEDSPMNAINHQKSRLEASKNGSNFANSTEIDPNAFINVKPKHLKTLLPDDVTEGDDILDDSDNENGEDNQRNIISEAFADDDVVDDFRKEKELEIKKSQPEDLDMRLPGWGSWGGKNIKAALRKKRRFIVKLPKDAPRRDENKGNVIIMEDVSQIKKHQVNDLPYPFTAVADFEAATRAPIGRTFVPENAHRRLIKPAITTKLGTIIDPMDEDILMKKTDTIKGNLGEKDKGIRKRKKSIK